MWKFLIYSPRTPQSKFSYYRLKNSHCDRLKDSKKLRNVYPDKIGVIVEPDTSFINMGGDNLMKTFKYILDYDYKLINLMIYLRKILFIEPSDSIFFFAGDNSQYIPNLSDTIGKIANKCISSDGFLYITFTKEESFG